MDQFKNILISKNVKIFDNKVSIKDYYKNIDSTLSSKVKKSIRDKEKHNRNIQTEYISIINFCKIIRKSISQPTIDFYTKYKETIDHVIYSHDYMYCVADLVDKRFIYQGKQIDFVETDNKFWFNVMDICKITNAKILIQHLDNIHKYKSNDKLYVDYVGLKYIDYDDKSDKYAISWIYQNILPLFNDAWKYTSECIKNINILDYKNKYCVYLLKLRPNTYKYGDSYIIGNRIKTHKDSLGKFEYVKIYTFDDYRDMKHMAHSVKIYTKEQHIDYIDTCGRVELFKTDNINKIISDINQLYEKYHKIRNSLPHSSIYYETLVNLNKLKDTETAYKLVTNPELYPDQILVKLNVDCMDKIRATEKQEKYLNKIRKTAKCKLCNISVHYNALYCQNCCKISQRVVKNRPSKVQLLKMIQETSYVAVGKKYGVSDNAVRKWLR
jgi:hypothetical protein